jgi:Inner membrane component of T3SS, cytoplasmic domain
MMLELSFSYSPSRVRSPRKGNPAARTGQVCRVATPGWRKTRIMKLYLEVKRGKQQGTVLLFRGDLFVLGSDPACQLRSDRPGIAPQHCALIVRQRKVFVRDLNGGQPTLLNDDLVPPGEEWAVHSGDLLNIGPLEFQIQFREKPVSQRDSEEWALRYLDTATIEEVSHDTHNSKYVPDTPSDAAASILEKLGAKRGVVKGRLRIGWDSGITVVGFADRRLVEEAEIELIKKDLVESLPSVPLRVLLDFKNIRRLSSLAVNTLLLSLHRQLQARESTLAFCRVRPDLLPILRTMDVVAQVPYFPDKESALAARW